MWSAAHFICFIFIFVPFIEGQSDNGIYTVVAPKTIRPNSRYNVGVSVESEIPVKVLVYLTATVSSRVASTSNEERVIEPGTSSMITLAVGDLIQGATYNLTVQGTEGIRFQNSTELSTNSKTASILIQTDKPIYKPGTACNLEPNQDFKDGIELILLAYNLDIIATSVALPGLASVFLRTGHPLFTNPILDSFISAICLNVVTVDHPLGFMVKCIWLIVLGSRGAGHSGLSLGFVGSIIIMYVTSIAFWLKRCNKSLSTIGKKKTVPWPQIYRMLQCLNKSLNAFWRYINGMIYHLGICIIINALYTLIKYHSNLVLSVWVGVVAIIYVVSVPKVLHKLCESYATFQKIQQTVLRDMSCTKWERKFWNSCTPLSNWFFDIFCIERK